MMDQMVSTFNTRTAMATVIVNQEKVTEVNVVVIQTKNGKTVGMASAQVKNPQTKRCPPPPAGQNQQYQFDVPMTLSDEAKVFPNALATGAAFGTWTGGVPFNWVNDGVRITKAAPRASGGRQH